MSTVALSKKIYALWEKEHSDVPWLHQVVSINTNEKNEDIFSWKILIQGGSGTYNIVAIDGQGKEIDEIYYSLSIDPKDDAIVLTPGESCPSINKINILQLGAPQLAKILCIEKPKRTDDSWVIFNSRSNEKRLLERISQCLQHQSEPTAYPLLKALHALINQQNTELLNQLESNSQLINKTGLITPFLNRYQLEYNAHGLKKTFRFWHTDEKKTYLREVAELIDHLSSLSPGKIALGFGAVLGKYRENDLIAHDDDLDVILAFDHSKVPSIATALSLLDQHLHNTAWTVQGHFFSHLWVGLPCGYRADVFVGLIEGSGMLSFYPSARHSLEVQQVFPPIKTSLADVDLPFPAQPHPYLERTYGPDWQTPLIAFSHPWDRSQYVDIAGQHSSKTMTTRGEMVSRQRRASGQ